MNRRHYLHVFATFCAAGPQVRAAALMRAFAASARHTVVSLDGRTGALGLVGDADVELRAAAHGVAPGARLRFLRRLIRETRPDLLLSYNWGAIETSAAARSLGWRRHVHHEDGFNADEARRLKRRRNWARRLLLRDTDVIVPSRLLEQIALRTWRLRRLHFVANGIDADAFARDPALGKSFRREHGIADDAVVVGAVGHLRPVKNLPRLIRAVAAVADPRLQLVIVGDGGERERLENLAAETGIAAHFTGHLASPRAAYSAMDVFALSSDSEQQPVALLEAMAAGLPVCSTDVGDVGQTLPGNARDGLVPPGPAAHEGLAAGLRELLDRPQRRRQLGEANCRHVRERYSEQAMLARYSDIYTAAAKRPAAP